MYATLSRERIETAPEYVESARSLASLKIALLSLRQAALLAAGIQPKNGAAIWKEL